MLVEDGQVTYARILNSGGNCPPVSNELLKDLLKVPNLRHVELAGSGIADRQLELIGKVSSLDTLDLSQTSIGDTGIQHLVNLDKLRHLNLMGSKVTAEGIQQLRAALPSCDIQPGGVQPTRVTLPAQIKVLDQSQE